MVILTALAAALAFSLGQVSVRLGLVHGSPTSAVTYAMLTMAPLVWLTLGPFASWEAFTLPGALWFMLAGAVAPMGTQILLFASTLRVGVARASPLRNTSPLFASLLAIFFLGESWTLPVAASTMAIVAGATLLGTDRARPMEGYRRSHLWLALAAGFLGGFSDPMRKFGLGLLADLPLALCFLALGSLVSLVLYLASGQYRLLTTDRRAVKWFVLSGLASGLGVSLSLLAMKLGTVVIVSPLTATVPLFTLLLGVIFLRRLETVNRRVVLGSLLICLGAAALGFFG